MPSQQRPIPPDQQMVPQNPFDAVGIPGYNNGMVPDTPLPDPGSAMLKALIEDDTTGEEFKREFPWIFGKDTVLTFIDEQRKQEKLISFDILKIDALNILPWYKYDWDVEAKWGVARHIFETRLDRAFGFEQNKRINERIVEQMQFTEHRQIINDEQQRPSVGREGWLRRILGKR